MMVILHVPSHILYACLDVKMWFVAKQPIFSHMQVVKEKLAGPDFVWLLPGWYRANWWAAVDGTDCTAEEMSKALEHTIVGNGIAICDDDLSRILASNKVRVSIICIKFSFH